MTMTVERARLIWRMWVCSLDLRKRTGFSKITCDVSNYWFLRWCALPYPIASAAMTAEGH